MPKWIIKCKNKENGTELIDYVFSYKSALAHLKANAGNPEWIHTFQLDVTKKE